LSNNGHNAPTKPYNTHTSPYKTQTNPYNQAILHATKCHITQQWNDNTRFYRHNVNNTKRLLALLGVFAVAVLCCTIQPTAHLWAFKARSLCDAAGLKIAHPTTYRETWQACISHRIGRKAIEKPAPAGLSPTPI
jgi:hypothetical protein